MAWYFISLVVIMFWYLSSFYYELSPDGPRRTLYSNREALQSNESSCADTSWLTYNKVMSEQEKLKSVSTRMKLPFVSQLLVTYAGVFACNCDAIRRGYRFRGHCG